MKQAHPFFPLAVGGFAAVLLLNIIWQTLRPPAPFSLAIAARRSLVLKQKAFVLMVTVTFENVAHKEAFTAFWQPLAHYVRGNEPGTLAFELLQSDSKPTELLVYERYIDKAYYLSVHKTSAAMATFKQTMATAPFDIKLAGQSYNELNVGFML